MADRKSKRRDLLAAAERRARALEAEIADTREELRQLRSLDPAGARARKAEARLVDLEKQRRKTLDTARAERLLAEREEKTTIKPIKVEDLDRDLPLLLLPVRLETRFVKVSDVKWQLLVRIYPDEIHIDSHEEELTSSEVRWGRHFWEQVWKWKNERSRTNAAWRQLVERYGGPRAAWIARALMPVGFDPKLLTDPWGPGTPPPLRFPAVSRKGSSWSRAAKADLLPDSWTVWCLKDGAVAVAATGLQVKRELAVGPDPSAVGKPDEGAEPQVIDEGMRWMVAFEEAVAVGMALRIDIGERDRFDTVVVFGLRSGEPPLLSDELFRHVETLRFGRGLEFLRQGTPTNNTDAVRSGWEAGADDDASVAGMLRWLGPEPDVKTGDNADATSTALWLPLETFARVPRGNETEQVDAGMLNDLLWSTTWGYYLTEMINDGIIGAGALAWLREHWVDYVRGRGPLPAWRVGDQPYGVLPVLCGTAADPQTPEEHMEVTLRTIRTIWDRSIPEVTRIRLESPDSDRDLVHALATLPHPERFAVRGVVDRPTLQQAAQAMSDPWDGWRFVLPGVRDLFVSLFQANGINGGRPEVMDVIYTDGSREWVAPLVTATELSEVDPLPGNYLDWMAKATPQQLINENHPYEKNTLLYVLARRSGRIDDGSGAGTPTSVRFREAARHLASLPTARLEQLLRETLGTCAYRLDAWETSLAARQLVINRGVIESEPGRKRGIQLGGYGWVEDLVARPPLVGSGSTKPGTGGLFDPKNPKTGPVIGGPLSNLPGSGGFDLPDIPDIPDLPPVDPANTGYVHAPSLQHATTASVLRSAWLSHGGSAGTPMAVDLSSARARDAAELLDGVRNGLGLGELLGYRFERGLHEGHPGVELDQFIVEFRELAPLVAGKQPGTDAPGAPARAQAARTVVDGLRLLDLWRTSDSGLAELLNTIDTKVANGRAAVEDELGALARAVDAVADTAMAEGIHQLLQGNQARSGAITEAVSTGELPPPELEITAPAWSGRGVTHRLLLALGATAPAASTWPGAGVTPRALAEPRLENWLASLFGDPTRIVARVGYLPPGSEEPVGLRTFRLSELGLSAIDMVMLVPGQKADAGELGARIGWVLLRNRPANVPEGSTPWVDPEWSEKPPPQEVCLADFLMLARAARRVVAEARPLGASDLSLPADGFTRKLDLAELLARSNDAVGKLRDALAALVDVDPSAPADQLVESLREALRSLADLGVSGAFPRSVVGAGEAEVKALLAQRATVGAQVKSSLAQAGSDDDVAAKVADSSEEEAEKLLAARIRAVFGKGFPVLPFFSTPNFNALETTFANSEVFQGGDRFASAGWLERTARVQQRTETFLRAIQFAEAFSDTTHLALEVGQLPYAVGELWAALPPPPGQSTREGRLSLVVQTFGPRQFDRPLQGLVIDEWAEVIPRERQSTAVAFHYDAPASRAPQAMLLLTLFHTLPAWNDGVVLNGLLNALQGAQRRLADSNALVDGGHLLPAIYLQSDPQAGQLAGDLARGVVSDEDSIQVDHTRPEFDIDFQPSPP